MEEKSEDLRASTTIRDDEYATDFACGRYLSSAPPGEEIVISGLAGAYPDSYDVYHFRDNLYNKVDMVTDDNRRWSSSHPEIPPRGGKLMDIKSFDGGYFGVHHRQVQSLDPQLRVLLEKTVEAVMDAGVNPKELEGSRTGVFVGCCFTESEREWFQENPKSQHYAVTGLIKSMMAHRLSYFLKLKGPSFTCDTACSSSLYALEQAFKSIRSGMCDQAIVGGSNLCLHPFVTLQFARLGVLSKDGKCKCFDSAGDGYARSEAIVAVFLQKSKDARRIYCNLIHLKTNNDGYKEQGITFPSGETQKRLLNEIYEEAQMDPNMLSFVEAHGTGTKVGDPEEVDSIDSAFCKNRDGHLLIGSVKSNIGHSEPSSGLCSITKVIIGMENGYIPPNVNFQTPREGCEALEKGRLRVVVDKMPFEDDRGIIGVNSFGFGGGNCHVLTRWNTKVKIDKGQPKDDLPRLVCISGRTEESVNFILDDIKNRELDAEYIRLYHQLFSKDIEGHLYRGYIIRSKTDSELERSVVQFPELKRPVHLYFTDFSTWATIANDLYVLPQFAASIQRTHNTLSAQGINLKEIVLTNGQKRHQHDAFQAILGVAAVQIGIVDLLKTVGLKFDSYSGLGLGQFVCSYLDQALSLEQIIKCLYQIAVQCKGITVDKLSKHYSKIKPELLGLLSKTLPGQPLKTSDRWLPPNTPVSAEFFLNCLSGAAPAVEVGRETVVLEIGDAQLDHSDGLSFNTDTKGGFLVLLKLIGRLYQYGHSVDISKLYPPVQYPVSRGTPMISPMIKWKHNQDWHIVKYGIRYNVDKTKMAFTYVVGDELFQTVAGHVIDGRFLYPATNYLFIAWTTLAEMRGKLFFNMKVVFENVKFLRATGTSGQVTEFIVAMQQATGNFEITESDELVVSGRITACDDDKELDQVGAVEPQYLNKSCTWPMKNKDIYKELRLRGYSYSGPFKGIEEYDYENLKGNLSWKQNWVSFIDTMLQLKILQLDSRLLYVPVEIQRISIDAPQHMVYIESLGENPSLPAYMSSHCDLIKCGFVEIRGLLARSIPRRKPKGLPVLERYEFVPNTHSLSIEQGIRVNVQLILENLQTITVKVVEVLDNDIPEGFQPLSNLIADALSDLPLIRPEITILSKNPLENCSFTVEDTKLPTHTDCVLVVGNKMLHNTILLQQALGALKAGGFILSRESRDAEIGVSGDIDVLTINETDQEKLVLMRKHTEMKPPLVVEVSNTDQEFTWLAELKKADKSQNTVFVVSQNDPANGVLGLVNCMKRESAGDSLRAVFVVDEAPLFDPTLPFYKAHLEKNLAINVYKNGQWGTYRHLLLEASGGVECEQAFVNVLHRGDLSSLRWFQGPYTRESRLEYGKQFVHVYYGGLNFRDIMMATGRISVDVITRERTKQECVIGFEYSGRTLSGRRVMGLVKAGALSTFLDADNGFIWEVPDKWSLEEAATIPCVYATVLYALLMVAKIKRGQTILIHAGSGGIGQAAITIALHHGATVYTTVGTQEKRDFLKKQFPQLKDHHIGNSRDISFEQMIHDRTHGRGVNIVLNSLAEEKLVASVRCLARHGVFLEIGKFDLMKNSQLALLFMNKEATFHGVMLDAFFDEYHPLNLTIREILNLYIQNDIIRPLVRTVFKEDQLEEAFRFMAGGKHIGKVLIQVRKEEKEKTVVPPLRLMRALPRYFCDPEKVHIVIGGLGGFGMELADWLVLRNCRRIVLTSRTGINSGYHAYRIRLWKSYGATVLVSTADITTREGCADMLREAQSLGPIEGVFNLAVVLKDALFENQTEENFKTSFLPKAIATQHLDELTRKMCPDLRSFVVFSSVSCGRGNAGQTNYGMANSVMERICEQRRDEGFPATAIEWGAVGDVGLVAQMQENDVQLEIGGTLQQPIRSCLEVMDELLSQKCAVVSSMVVAEKRRGIGGAENIVDAVANILGIKDIKTVSPHATLPELGMDSMSGVEIKQVLEREYDVFLTPEEMRSMTFARLQEIQDERAKEGDSKVKKDRPVVGFEMILRFFTDEASSKIALMRLESLLEESAPGPQVFMFPGLEGVCKVFESLAKNLKAHTLCLQYLQDNFPNDVSGMSSQLAKVVKSNMVKSKPFTVIAHSYGSVLAMEVVSMLEAEGHTGQLILLDGAPYMMKYLLRNILDVGSEAQFQTGFLCQVMSLHVPYDVILKNKDTILGFSTFDDRLKFCSTIFQNDTAFSVPFWIRTAKATYKRLTMLYSYETLYKKLASPVKLFKPTILSVPTLAEDYKLTELTEHPVEVKSFEGNHVTILDNLEMATAINEVLEPVDETILKKPPVTENPTDPARIAEKQEEEETRQI